VTQNTNEFVPCPRCDGSKRADCAVCATCKKAYTRLAAEAVVNGQEVPTQRKWLIDEINAQLPRLKQNILTAQEKVSQCQQAKEQKLVEMLCERVRGQNISPEILAEAQNMLADREGKGIWADVGGNTAYKNLQISRGRLTEARRLLEDLEKPREEED